MPMALREEGWGWNGPPHVLCPASVRDSGQKRKGNIRDNYFCLVSATSNHTFSEFTFGISRPIRFPLH